MHPRPSDEYIEFLQFYNLGSVWTTDDPEFDALLYNGLTHAFQIHEPGSLLRQVNSNGDRFLVEMHFVNRSGPPNAWVGRSGDRFCIAVCTSCYVFLDCLTSLLAGDDGFIASLQNSGDSDDELLRGVMRSSVGLIAAPVYILQAATLQEYLDATRRFRSESLERKAWATLIRNFGLSYIVHHEYGHIICGHLGLRAAQAEGPIVESYVGKVDDPSTIERRDLEIFADGHAVRSLFQNSLAGYYMRGGTSGSVSYGMILTACLLGTFLTHAMLGWFRIAGNYKNTAVSDNISAYKNMTDAITEQGDYPSTAFRISYIILKLKETLEFISAQETIMYVTDADINAGFTGYNRCIIYIAKRFFEFGAILGPGRDQIEKIANQLVGLDGGADLLDKCSKFDFL